MPLPPEIVSQRDVANYVLDLWGAGTLCHDKLMAIGGLVEQVGHPGM